MQVVPLGDVLPLGIEDLDAVVLAVCYVNISVHVRADAMDEIELARIGTRRTPGEEQFSVGRIFMYT